jgi:hypothetical protein
VVHEKLHTPAAGSAGAQALAAEALTVMHDAPVPRLPQPLAQVVVHVPQKHRSPAPHSDSCSQGASQFVCESVPLVVELQASNTPVIERRTVSE